MSNKTTAIPEPAVRLNKRLSGIYDKSHPFILGKPCRITRKIDSHGLLEFDEWEVTSCWPSAGSVTVSDAQGNTAHIYDSFDDDADAGDSTWICDNLEKTVAGRLDTTAKEVLLTLLAKAVPVGRLCLPDGHTIQLREANGGTAPYILEAVWTEQGKPYVRYGDSSCRYEHPAEDFSTEDVCSILASIGHPAPGCYPAQAKR